MNLDIMGFGGVFLCVFMAALIVHGLFKDRRHFQKVRKDSKTKK